MVVLIIRQQQGNCEVDGLHCFGLARIGTKLPRGGEHTRVGRVTTAFAQSDQQRSALAGTLPATANHILRLSETSANSGVRRVPVALGQTR